MEYKDGQPMRDKVHIVLTGPDGKIKQERTIERVLVTEEGNVYTADGTFIKNINIQEATNEDNERHGV